MTEKKGLNRRDFFKVAAVSGAGTALAACNNDGVETLLPRMVPPDDMVIGTPYYFNTTCRDCESACGITVKTREGRALSVAGNALHPINAGAVCAVGQSAVQHLYSPGRIKTPQVSGSAMDWDSALTKVSEEIAANRQSGKRAVIITKNETGAEADLLKEFAQQAGAEIIELDLNPDNALRSAAEKLYGVFEKPVYHIDQAETLINFGSDFLESWNTPTENSRKFADMYAFKNGKKGRFIHVSPHLSLTGSNADTWLAANSGSEVYVAYFLINVLLDRSTLDQAQKDEIKALTDSYTVGRVAELTGIAEKKLTSAADVISSAQNIVAVSGGNQSAGSASFSLHHAVLLLNQVAGSMNRLVEFGQETKAPVSTAADIIQLAKDAAAGAIGVLMLHRVNPVYALPGFGENMKTVPFKVALDVSATETTLAADAVLPINHYLESWGDANPRNGVYSLQQPVMATVPGFNALPTGDIILQLSAKLGFTEGNLSSPDFITYLKSRWQKIAADTGSLQNFNDFWKQSLQNGVVRVTAQPADPVTPLENFARLSADQNPVSDGLDKLTLSVTNSVFNKVSGETGDRPWLLEIPHPVTQIVWDSWVEINADRAIEMGINHGDEVELTTEFGSGIYGAYVYHGVAYNSLNVPGGMGRSVLFPNYSQRRNIFLPFTQDNPKQLKLFKVGENASSMLGLSADLTGNDFVYSGVNVSLKKTGNKAGFVSLDGQYRDDKEALIRDSKAGFGDRGQKGRGIVQDTTPEEIATGGGDHGHHLLDRHYTVDTIDQRDFYYPMPETVKESIFFKEPNDNPTYYDPYKFEMVIDLDKCTGCSSCVVACFAENNVAVVGKERQSLGREMSWIRIERFFDQNEAGETVTNMIPTMCSQCGNAGCEPVCPVYAAYHNPDGLNVQVYNRCVGTRYCANNCIYKQRRFNWRTYEFPEPLNMQLNPDVTVRSKGVMEKCTFCLQRIVYAKDKAKDEGRIVRDGEIVTACQAACPTHAISFGNAMDEGSDVSIKKQSNRGYVLFKDVNFKPSVTYLKKVRHHKTA